LNRNRSITAALAAAATVALGVGLAQAMPASATTTPTPKYVVLNCSEKPVTQPANWTPFCADYGTVLEDMHWTSWTSHLASGYGTVYEDDNYPSHVEGKVYKVPALVTLWGSVAIKSHPGDDSYTEMTLIFPDQRPAVYEKVNGKWTATYPQTQTWGF
jgi:hypothetical protein